MGSFWRGGGDQWLRSSCNYASVVSVRGVWTSGSKGYQLDGPILVEAKDSGGARPVSGAAILPDVRSHFVVVKR